MIRSLLRATLTIAALALIAGSRASAQTPAEGEGNKMERKGNQEEKAADAEKARGAQMEKQGKAKEKAGKKSDNKAEEESGKRMKKKGHAIEKDGEARKEIEMVLAFHVTRDGEDRLHRSLKHDHGRGDEGNCERRIAPGEELQAFHG